MTSLAVEELSNNKLKLFLGGLALKKLSHLNYRHPLGCHTENLLEY